jgi:hypothetical protein
MLCGWQPDEEKRLHLSGLAGVGAEKLPHLTVGGKGSKKVRVFPDPLPIGVDLNGRCVFLYLVSRDRLDDFRAFLQRHADLFAALPTWTLRVIIPPHLACIASFCEAIVRDEFARAVDPRLIKMLLVLHAAAASDN